MFGSQSDHRSASRSRGLHIFRYFDVFGPVSVLDNRVYAKVRSSKLTPSKIVPKAIFAVHLKKRAKMYFIEGRFFKSCGIFCHSVLLAYNVPSICPRQNASATAYSAQTGGPKQDNSTDVCTAAAQAMNARRIEKGITLSMTHTRNIRDYVQQAGDTSVCCCALRP